MGLLDLDLGLMFNFVNMYVYVWPESMLRIIWALPKFRYFFKI